MNEIENQAITGEKVSPSQLFFSFLRLGLTAFGGPAMIAYMREMAVAKKLWLSDESFHNGVVLCQSIPGATAMQTAAYIGYRASGIAGAAAAYIGFMLPAFALMFALSVVYASTRDLPAIVSAFAGLRVVVVAIILNALIAFGQKTIKKSPDIAIALVSALLLIIGGNPAFVILFAGLAGILVNKAPASALGDGHDAAINHPLKPIGIGLLAAGVAVAVLFFLNQRLAQLALIMFKVDVLGFGGGFASVPLMMHELVDARGWLARPVFMDGIALGQVTPGPIVITATFVGYQLIGWAGALVGTLAIFTSSFLMVLAAVPYFDRLYRSEWFRRAVRGILTAFVGLLLAVTIQFGGAISWTIPAVILACGTFAALRFKADILWVVLSGGVLSALLKL